MLRRAFPMLLVLLVARVAPAQVTDADRNAARDLYIEGEALRKQGRFQDALERYNRSLQVYPAPTTAFRIAQCRASLGLLVEAAEEYRLVANTPLPPNSSEAFTQARADATAELAAIEPRIPKVRINVQPYPLNGLTIMIDTTPMPVALVGVARPINPGQHRITAQAPGYQTAQATLTVQERQVPMPEVALVLQPAPQTTQYTTTTNPNYVYPNTTYNNTYPYAYPYNTWVPPRRQEGPRSAFLIGIDGALSIPFGNLSQGTSDLTTAFGVGGGFGLDVGFRLARILYLGGTLQGSFFGGNNGSSAGGQSLALDAVLGIMTNPEGAGFYVEFGGGYRDISVTNVEADSGFDVIFGIGAQIKAGSFRFIPKADLFVGSAGGVFHGFFTLGLTGYWELPLDRPATVSATVAAPPP